MRKELILAVIVSIVFVVGLVKMGNAQSSIPNADLSGSTGFYVMTDLTVASDSATIAGTMPVNCRYLLARAVSSDVNYGTSAISTGTSHLYIPIGEERVFGPFTTRNPVVYFRTRGTATGTTVLVLEAGPNVSKP